MALSRTILNNIDRTYTLSTRLALNLARQLLLKPRHTSHTTLLPMHRTLSYSPTLNSKKPCRYNFVKSCDFRMNGLQTLQIHRHMCTDRSLSTNPGSLKNEKTTKILYDSECKICAVEISGLKRWTRNKTDVEFIDITSPDYDPSKCSGVTYEDAMKEMHVIGSDGKVYIQGDAIRLMYRACGFGWLATVTELPGLKPVFDRLYMKFAEYRLKKALDRCDNGSCSIKLHNLRNKLNKLEQGKE